MKGFFFIMVIVFGGLYFFFKDRDITDVHKAVGTKGYATKKTKKDLKKEEEKPNKYDAGNCLQVARNTQWEVNKIVRVDLEKEEYHYIFCVKFKGCQKEVQKELFSNFEYDYPESLKVNCP